MLKFANGHGSLIGRNMLPDEENSQRCKDVALPVTEGSTLLEYRGTQDTIGAGFVWEVYPDLTPPPRVRGAPSPDV